MQRPQAAAEERGVDLGQVATDTLGILQRRSFTTPAVHGDPEDWVTKVLGGNATTAQTVDGFLSQVLPTGSKHVVRLSNGVATVPLLPTASPGLPRGARAAEVPFFPHWTAFAANLTASAALATPGMPVASGTVPYQFTDPAAQLCIKSPTNSSTGPNGVAWASTAYWKATLGQVPAWALYGVWKGYAAADCSGAVTYLAVTLPGTRSITDGVTTGTPITLLTSASAGFTQDDVGRLVLGPSFPAGTFISAVDPATQTATLSQPATQAGAGLSATFAKDPTYPLYGLQLVVWFGA